MLPPTNLVASFGHLRFLGKQAVESSEILARNPAIRYTML